MPLFKKSDTTTQAPQAAPAPAPAPARTSTSSGGGGGGGGGGFFSSHRRSGSHSPTGATTTTTAAQPQPQAHKSSSNPISRALNRNKAGSTSVPEDPSITAARQRVMGAERAERDADRALVAARASVRDARAEVGRLEAEAAEDARLAKLKQGQAKDLHKRAKPLGRHG